jgi:hypothetical protein
VSEAELVSIETFNTRLDASVALGALRAAEIHAVISADDAGAVYPGGMMQGVRLLVRADDVERAKEVLSLAPELDPEE